MLWVAVLTWAFKGGSLVMQKVFNFSASVSKSSFIVSSESCALILWITKSSLAKFFENASHLSTNYKRFSTVWASAITVCLTVLELIVSTFCWIAFARKSSGKRILLTSCSVRRSRSYWSAGLLSLLSRLFYTDYIILDLLVDLRVLIFFIRSSCLSVVVRVEKPNKSNICVMTRARRLKLRHSVARYLSSICYSKITVLRLLLWMSSTTLLSNCSWDCIMLKST